MLIPLAIGIDIAGVFKIYHKRLTISNDNESLSKVITRYTPSYPPITIIYPK